MMKIAEEKVYSFGNRKQFTSSCGNPSEVAPCSSSGAGFVRSLWSRSRSPDEEGRSPGVRSQGPIHVYLGNQNRGH